jgi:ABC-2 type transport system permease protein
MSLRRDRASLALSFILPVAFFTIFAVIFGGQRDTTPKISVIVVDEDHSPASLKLIQGLRAESALEVLNKPESKSQVDSADYTAVTAEDDVKAGKAPLALIIPHGFGENPISFGPPPPGQATTPPIQMLQDSSDMVAPQMMLGLLQKVAMTSMPDVMAEMGSKYMDAYAGGFTPEQRRRIQEGLDQLRQRENGQQPKSADSSKDFSLINVKVRDVVGENKKNPMVSFYAAAIGVMFLMFTASGASGSLLDEAESGALDRVLSTRVTMGALLAGKLTFCAMLAFTQLVVMFVWAWLVFKIDLLSHIPGFIIMGLSTAFAVGAFGMLLASLCRTRAQLGALSTLVILIMSSIGGSMFPRFLMPPAMQTAGLFTINAWAIDGFSKVFWRDEPISHLWPQVSVLLAVGVVLFLIARKVAQRWEYA